MHHFTYPCIRPDVASRCNAAISCDSTGNITSTSETRSSPSLLLQQCRGIKAAVYDACRIQQGIPITCIEKVMQIRLRGYIEDGSAPASRFQSIPRQVSTQPKLLLRQSSAGCIEVDPCALKLTCSWTHLGSSTRSVRLPRTVSNPHISPG